MHSHKSVFHITNHCLLRKAKLGCTENILIVNLMILSDTSCTQKNAKLNGLIMSSSDEDFPLLPPNYAPSSRLDLPPVTIVPGYETLSLITLGIALSRTGAANRYYFLQEINSSTKIQRFTLSSFFTGVRFINMHDVLRKVQSEMFPEHASESLITALLDTNENLLQTIRECWQFCFTVPLLAPDVDIQDCTDFDRGVIVLTEKPTFLESLPKFIGPLSYGGSRIPDEDESLERGYARLTWAVGSEKGSIKLFYFVQIPKGGNTANFMLCISKSGTKAVNLERYDDCETIRVYAACYEYNEVDYLPEEIINVHRVKNKVLSQSVTHAYSSVIRQQSRGWDDVSKWPLCDYLCECLRFPELFILGISGGSMDLALSAGTAVRISADVDKISQARLYNSLPWNVKENSFEMAVREYATFTEWIYHVISLIKLLGEKHDDWSVIESYFRFVPVANPLLLDFAVSFGVWLYEEMARVGLTELAGRIQNCLIGILDPSSYGQIGWKCSNSVDRNYSITLGYCSPGRTKVGNPREMIRKLQKWFREVPSEMRRFSGIQLHKNYLAFRQQTYTNIAIYF